MPNPTKRRAAYSVTSNVISDKGIITSGDNKVICGALLVMTIVFLKSELSFERVLEILSKK